jgi:hypothetical protein
MGKDPSPSGVDFMKLAVLRSEFYFLGAFIPTYLL